MKRKTQRSPARRLSKEETEKLKECIIFNVAMGLSLEQIYSKLEFSNTIYYRFLKEDPAFAEKLKNAKEIVDSEVVASCFKRATGFYQKIKKPIVISDGMEQGSHVEIVEYEEYFPPHHTAISYWLNNRQPHKWKNKHVIEEQAKQMTDDELKQKAKEILLGQSTEMDTEETDS